MGKKKGPPEKKQVLLSDEAKSAMAHAIDIMLQVGASWSTVRIQLFRMTLDQGCAWTQVPSQFTLEEIVLKEFECKNFSEYREKRDGSLKSLLKGKAVNMALSGHATMLIFCLKNLCGWSDQVQVLPDKDDAKNQIQLAYANSNQNRA